MRMSPKAWRGMSVLLVVAATGCPIPPSDACEKYVACQKHYDEVNDLQSDDLDELYGEEGRCWRDEQSATSCTSSCEVATDRLAEGLAASGDDPGPCD